MGEFATDALDCEAADVFCCGSAADFKLVRIGSLLFASAGLPRGKFVITCFVACRRMRYHA